MNQNNRSPNAKRPTSGSCSQCGAPKPEGYQTCGASECQEAASRKPTRTVRQSRNRSTGRYSYEGQWDRLCVCGHTLGNHLAEAPHGCDEGHSDACGCARFRPAARKG